MVFLLCVLPLRSAEGSQSHAGHRSWWRSIAGTLLVFRTMPGRPRMIAWTESPTKWFLSLRHRGWAARFLSTGWGAMSRFNIEPYCVWIGASLAGRVQDRHGAPL